MRFAVGRAAGKFRRLGNEGVVLPVFRPLRQPFPRGIRLFLLSPKGAT